MKCSHHLQLCLYGLAVLQNLFCIAGKNYQVQQAGFILDRVSDMFFQESDDLTKEVGEIPNMTDRFFLVFQKPE